MNRVIKPADGLQGEIDLPASKSYSIRAFIIAACGGHSTIIHPSDSDDARVAVNAAKALGAKMVVHPNNVWDIIASPDNARITKINVGESGTVLRLILPLLSWRGQKTIVVGEGTLKGRPNKFLLKALRAMGVDIRGTGTNESVPITIAGGHLSPGVIKMDGSLSSQFVSALLITCPQLSGDTKLILTGEKIVSVDYITMTRQILQKTGVSIASRGGRTFLIKGRQRFKGLKKFFVPSDYGLAAFPLAACSLIKSEVTLKGYLRDEFIQADGHILPLLRKMGVRFVKTSTGIKMSGPYNLKGGAFSLKDCPDLVPIMAVLALFAKQKTRLYDIGHARVKESDRISDLRKELLKVGAKITETQNELIIYPRSKYRSDRVLDPHHDHRLAMAFCILGLKLGVTVKDTECINKSYPAFISDIEAIGAKVR